MAAGKDRLLCAIRAEGSEYGLKVIRAGYEIIRPNIKDGGAGRDAIYKLIEQAGRTCYKSEDKATDGSAAKFVCSMVKSQHEAMLEHASMTVKFIVDRAVANEIVRHRIASFAQESTRYCNYGAEKFGKEITVIEPFYLEKGTRGYSDWAVACSTAEDMYFDMLNFGCLPEEARAVLPLSTKTEIVVTANMREWRHFFKLRAEGVTGRPHPQMVEVTKPLLGELKEYMPELFGDIGGND